MFATAYMGRKRWRSLPPLFVNCPKTNQVHTNPLLNATPQKNTPDAKTPGWQPGSFACLFLLKNYYFFLTDFFAGAFLAAFLADVFFAAFLAPFSPETSLPPTSWLLLSSLPKEYLVCW